jgi:hypothetical protein
MINFYKPNSKKTGHACSFQYAKDGNFYFSFAKQTGWNDSTKTGSFKSNDRSNTINGKLSETEVCQVIDSIDSNREFSAFHKSAKQTLSIKFGPYVRNEEQIGYTFSVNRKSETGESKGYLIGFNFGEAVQVKEFLKTALQAVFTEKIEKSQQLNMNSRPKKEEPVKQERPSQEEEDEIEIDF